MIKLFAKNGVAVKENLLKKNKGSVSNILCGIVAVFFLSIGSETLPAEEVANSDHVNESVMQSTIEGSIGGSEECNEVSEDKRATESVEYSETVRIENEDKKEDQDEDRKDDSAMENEQNVESVFLSSEERFEPVTSEPIVTDMEVHFIDVGQADAALVLCGGEAMLIDGGNTDDSSLMYTYLKNKGISYLDYVIATHAHEDHVGGLAGALNYADVGTVYCPVTTYDSEAFSDFKNFVEKNNSQIMVPM